MTGLAVSLDIYVDGQVLAKVAPGSAEEITIDAEQTEVFVKTSWCESNRVVITADTKLKVYARGGLLGATFNSLLRPKDTYILEEE